MLIKRWSEVNFINVLQAAFTHKDFKSTKKTIKLSTFFALLGSARVKAARITMMKLTPDVLFVLWGHSNNTWHSKGAGGSTKCHMNFFSYLNLNFMGFVMIYIVWESKIGL